MQDCKILQGFFSRVQGLWCWTTEESWQSWGVSVWERMTGSSANEVFVNAANSSEKRVEKDGKRKSSEKAKECRRRSKYSQNDDSIAARKKKKKYTY